ncbi:MAG: Asp-tRNA(Asn)/Glu-tRNA(Gln) amidotransferase subunit GatC [Bdellovibrionales bacterium]|nr:Asp-tRNA(Asn)/Glu-tRNA(Gln) amidotransferase subunit GatC [Bdellovibrionales bacterium]
MIDEQTVKKIARLARLSVTDAEVKDTAEKMSAILDHFKQMEKLNTDNVEPLRTASPIENCFREDQVIDRLDIEGALQNAPERSGNSFKVPPVV